MSATIPPSSSDALDDYERIQISADFIALRHLFRTTVSRITIVFLSWYFLYVVLATYAAPVLAISVLGNVNIGFLLAVGQFITTFAVTVAYRWWAGHSVDPLVARIRSRLEGSDLR